MLLRSAATSYCLHRLSCPPIYICRFSSPLFALLISIAIFSEKHKYTSPYSTLRPRNRLYTLYISTKDTPGAIRKMSPLMPHNASCNLLKGDPSTSLKSTDGILRLWALCCTVSLHYMLEIFLGTFPAAVILVLGQQVVSYELIEDNLISDTTMPDVRLYPQLKLLV